MFIFVSSLRNSVIYKLQYNKCGHICVFLFVKQSWRMSLKLASTKPTQNANPVKNVWVYMCTVPQSNVEFWHIEQWILDLWHFINYARFIYRCQLYVDPSLLVIYLVSCICNAVSSFGVLLIYHIVIGLIFSYQLVLFIYSCTVSIFYGLGFPLRIVLVLFRRCTLNENLQLCFVFFHFQSRFPFTCVRYLYYLHLRFSLCIMIWLLSQWFIVSADCLSTLVHSPQVFAFLVLCAICISASGKCGSNPPRTGSATFTIVAFKNNSIRK